ncbi:lipopolysaccharide biosynthesis protein [Texcoconibacillus texcoconensis]|uniref:O-antigen/teichoic acid export membrane protein n=1 Tax=Texcoconibacillus texcoconensis TaxID=1095777 RepID=A0A840QT62_9BACI|nr:lipopolysaccharide biosynthesis protein [Texcoconibacillus texcoconensis]MBB5174555.1 O-antigen/teichoic acid export membrane protein [Texcoconibacillus texcoconensis]
MEDKEVLSNLKSRAISSMKWTTFQTIIVGLSGPLLMIFKARYLTPEEFGVLAIVTIVIGLMNTIENFGISQAVIQKNEISREEQSSLFFFNIFLVLFLGGVLYTISDLLATVFDMPDLSYLLPLTSLIVIINGPSLLFRALLEKSLLFKEISLIKIFRNILLFIVTVLFLYLGYGLIGIVFAQLLAVASSVALILFVSLKNKLVNIMPYFSVKVIKPFLSFGIYVFGKQIMTFTTHRIDEVIIGLFLSNEILGIYHFAKNMLERLRNLITSSFSKVLFPVLSKLKNDINKLSNTYIRISKYLGFFAFPVFIGIAVTAEYFVPFIFGEQWIESIPFFQAFSIILIPLILTANLSSSLLYSLGKPSTVFYIDLVTNSLYVILLFIFAQFGIYAVVLAYGFYVVSKTMSLQFITSKQLLYGFFYYITEFKYILLASIVMTGFVLFVQTASDNYLDIRLIFGLSVLLGSIVYLVCLFKLENKAVKQLLKDVKIVK